MSQLSLNDHLSEKGLDKWLAQLGVTPAPVPRTNVRVALHFFAQHMMALPAGMALNFLRAMDLSRPVRSLTLSPPEAVIAFRVGNESPFKLFYTRPGASPYGSGINPAGRSIVRFRVRAAAPALKSYTTGAIDVWTVPADDQPLTVAPRSNTTGFMAAGGGIQLIIPRSHERLAMI
jgi:hypothetical protein